MKKLRILSLSLLIIVSCDQSGKEKADNTTQVSQPLQPSPSVSQAILKDSANKMITSYLQSVGNNDTAIKSLILDADQLRDYLSDQSIKYVKIMFAHTLHYINSGHGGRNSYYRPDQFTVILAGYDADNNYIYWGGENVMDNMLPCPAACPTSGTASENLLE